MHSPLALTSVSIQLVSPARGEGVLVLMSSIVSPFPFNWFPLREGRKTPGGTTSRRTPVSIQLVSPARGETMEIKTDKLTDGRVSIQLVSPARGECTPI